MANNKTIDLTARILPELVGLRLDQALAKLFPDYSRSVLQNWIQEGAVLLDNTPIVQTRHKVKLDQVVEIQATLIEHEHWEAQALPLNIVYEDCDLIVINKPPGLVVHPGAGNPDGTLLNALIHHDRSLATVPRAGIVHRLDKDTSGLLVIARNLATHHYLVNEMKARSIKREYQAVVKGVLITGGSFDAPIGRHPTQRTRMAVVGNGQEAITHYRVIERYRQHTHVHVQLETGRTHQIRVHFSHNRHPLVGDPLYGQSQGIAAQCTEVLRQTLKQFKRQALHASRLTLKHPSSQETLEWNAPLPEDFAQLINALEEDRGKP